MKSKRYILIISVIIIYFFQFIMVDNIKSKLIIKEIDEFQIKYAEYLSSEQKEYKKNLKNGLILNSNELSEYYDQLVGDFKKSFDSKFSKQLYEFNLFKNDNTKNYTIENKKAFDDLVKLNNDLLNEIKSTNNIKLLSNVELNNSKLNKILIKQQRVNYYVTKEYLLASKNISTTNTMLDDCFTKQENSKWVYEKESSINYCKALGLSNCDSKEFIGYTMNNPSKLASKNNYFDYVSYYSDYYKNSDINFNTLDKLKNVYVEVYSYNVFNRKIYKYNIIAVDKEYKLSCNIPTK